MPPMSLFLIVRVIRLGGKMTHYVIEWIASFGKEDWIAPPPLHGLRVRNFLIR